MIVFPTDKRQFCEFLNQCFSVLEATFLFVLCGLGVLPLLFSLDLTLGKPSEPFVFNILFCSSTLKISTIFFSVKKATKYIYLIYISQGSDTRPSCNSVIRIGFLKAGVFVCMSLL